MSFEVIVGLHFLHISANLSRSKLIPQKNLHLVIDDGLGLVLSTAANVSFVITKVLVGARWPRQVAYHREALA
jgi:hypothetical protein